MVDVDMLRVCIKPTTFEIKAYQENQNPYIDIHADNNVQKNVAEHKKLENTFSNIVIYTLKDITESIPDIVFVANGGICLPRIPRTIVLPYMKYEQRKRELKYLIEIYKDLGLNMIEFPGSSSAPFEGQAELKWFHKGSLGICGYGHRSTKKSFTIAKKLFADIYKSHGLVPPELVVLKLESPLYYHLDVAMLEFDDSKCIVHKRAFSEKSIETLKKCLGSENVYVIDVADTFCLNAVVDGKNLITHTLKEAGLKTMLEGITGRKIKQIDTSEFEKSGGSVRCMTLDIF
jgi:N-dimethylarginine dimethylaminohydrolase